MCVPGFNIYLNKNREKKYYWESLSCKHSKKQIANKTLMNVDYCYIFSDQQIHDHMLQKLYSAQSFPHITYCLFINI